jgi:alkylhydroperoxidase family enzyme
MSTRLRFALADSNSPSVSAVLAHDIALQRAFSGMQASLWELAADQTLIECVRIRNARVTDCGYCRNVRFDTPRRDGLSERALDMVTDGYEDSELSERQIAALKLADAVLFDARSLTAEAQSQVMSQFSDGEVVGLALATGFFMAMSKLIIVFGLEPEEMETTVVPTPLLSTLAENEPDG